MRHVKGTLLIDIIKTIKADKEGVFDKFITDEDKDLLSGPVLSATWYPYEVYKRCFNALGEVQAKGDMEVCRQWGLADIGNLTKNAYKSILSEKNYKVAFEKIQLFMKLMFDFGHLEIDFISDNKLQLVLKGFEPDFKVFYYFVLGWYENVLKMCGCTDIKSEFIVKSWEEAGDTTLRYSWTS